MRVFNLRGVGNFVFVLYKEIFYAAWLLPLCTTGGSHRTETRKKEKEKKKDMLIVTQKQSLSFGLRQTWALLWGEWCVLPTLDEWEERLLMGLTFLHLFLSLFPASFCLQSSIDKWLFSISFFSLLTQKKK